MHKPQSGRTRLWMIASVAVLAAGLAGLGISLAASGNSNVSATAHNLSKDGPGSVKAANESQVCVFCHTPHGANASVNAPLWNRAANTNSYTRYTSSSLDANTVLDGFSDQPGGSSLLCLSCHDGTVALAQVNVVPKTSRADGGIVMSGGTTMPTGYGVNTGFTRFLGKDLTNDHPISITYNDALAVADGELARMDANQKDTGTSGALIGPRTRGTRPPTLPLERTGPVGTDGLKAGQVQCATCHDPHLNKSKFLRLNRLQANAGPTGTFTAANDIICLACHTKLGNAWAQSAHADPNIADETYTNAAAALRGFPAGTQVWQASCLNCHDTHTVQGSRRLLREGVNGLDADLLTVPAGTAAAGAVYRPGFTAQAVDGTDGNNLTSAVENTCFQCHRASADSQIAISANTGSVPAIKTLFELTYGMPARSADQADPNAKERHNITNADLVEPATNLGRNDASARHAECPDCHNPHRVRRNSKFNGTGDASKRTHITGSGVEGNVASGVLRGGWGVQPTYSSPVKDRVWPVFPDGFDVKKGDPGTNTGTDPTSAGYLTREYQLCFKCHSNYANGDTTGSFPSIDYATNLRGTSRRGTPLTYSNGMTRYTNVAAEFASVNASVDANGLAVTGTDQGESTNAGTACGGADCASSGSVLVAPNPNPVYQSVNHRSWHPVMYPTGRDRAERKMGSTGTTNIRAPFEANMGKQTMYCADCHGQGTSYTPGVGPDLTKPQGPHGSQYPFLLRGDWSLSTTKIGSLTNQVCGYCHQPGSGTASPRSGFGNSHNGGGQGAMNNAPCMFCHVAVPHGWKNKAFLVNMNCVGAEGGQTGCTAMTISNGVSVPGSSSSYSAHYIPPYYNGAKIRINTWARSGSWAESSCTGNMTNCGSSY